MAHIVIIGNGVAGITAARNIRKRSDHRITVISSESDHFFSRPALMYIFMGHMEYNHTKPYEDWFWKKNRIDLLRDHATRIDTNAKTIALASGNTCQYDSVIFATGAQSNMAGWPGQNLTGVQGFTNLQDLQLLEQNVRSVRRAVIVGGGLIGVEVAEMLRSRDIDVTMLVRESSYWSNVLPPEESAMVSTHLLEHHIDVGFSTTLAEIVPDDQQRVRAIITSDNKQIDCQLVVLTAGVHPRIDLAIASDIPTRRGILVDDHFCTSIPDVHAIGDCAERPDGSVDLLWYTARAHGEALAATLCGERTVYDAGVFYNSAKFFDIEYQTYGSVPPTLDGVDSFTLWVRGKRGFLRVTHESGRVVGFNAMGIRLRADVCTQWIREGASLEGVLQNLEAAQFDEEFTTTLRASADGLRAKGQHAEGQHAA